MKFEIINPEGAVDSGIRIVDGDMEKISRGFLRSVVGGDLEYVRVLDDRDGRDPRYTTMVVNDCGLLLNLPRNQKATDLYLANCRRAFPKSENPSKAARVAYREQIKDVYGKEAKIINLAPDGDNPDDPYIAGNAVVIHIEIERLHTVLTG